MGKNTKIEWCHHTSNLWWGCVRINAGCDHCYAEILSNRFGDDVWGNDKPRKEIKSVWNDLVKYQKLAKEKNEIHRVFVGSMMDIFEKPMPLIDSKGKPNTNANTGNYRFQLFHQIDRGDYPNLMFLFLTKRPSNINKMIFESWKESPPTNVMFGTSPVNQETFKTLVTQLKEVKGKRFLSIEPQLSKIELGNMTGIDWIIQGGESGHHKRPFNIEWARSMRDECNKLGVPYFFKQIDKIQPIPNDLKIQQFPKI